MAMSLGGDESEAMSEINVTPLVDVMLVLLVVFLVTAPLLTQTVGVHLPKTAATAPNTEPKTVAIGVDAEGRITLDQMPTADPAQLEAALRGLVEQDPETHFHLHADQAVNYGQVAKVMAAAQRAGVTKLAFVTLDQ
jgi:biopolymer transport protein ExbD